MVLFDRQGSPSAQGDIGSVSLPQPPDIATTCTLSSSSLDSDDHVRTLAPRVLLQPPPGLEQYAPPPGLDNDAHLCASHGFLVKAAPLRPRLCSAISVTPPQPPACTIHVGTHPVRSATTGKRSASTALARIPVAATFWVNASRVILPLTIPNVKNPSIFILSLKEK